MAEKRASRRTSKRKRAGVTGPRGIEYRRVFTVGGSMGLTLPPACLRLLGAKEGGTVKVVPHPSGKVIIAPMRMRVGMAHELTAAAREVAYLRKLVGKLRKRAMAVPARSVAHGVSIGFAKAWGAQMMDHERILRALALAVGEVLERLDHPRLPAPPLLPSDVSEGGAMARGRSPEAIPS